MSNAIALVFVYSSKWHWSQRFISIIQKRFSAFIYCAAAGFVTWNGGARKNQFMQNVTETALWPPLFSFSWTFMIRTAEGLTWRCTQPTQIYNRINSKRIKRASWNVTAFLENIIFNVDTTKKNWKILLLLFFIIDRYCQLCLYDLYPLGTKMCPSGRKRRR